MRASKVVPVHATKVYLGMEVELHSFLISPPHGGERWAWSSACFILGTYRMVGLMGPRTRLNALDMKVSCSYRESNDSSIGHPVI